MINYIMAEQNSRSITGEDKIFGINKRAQEMILRVGRDKVVNATVGSLLDDEGNLVVLSSVVDAIKGLQPIDYAEYTPITGTPAYLDAVLRAVFRDDAPTCPVEAIATPGGTGAVRNAIQNYSRRGDVILTSDWYWSPYKTIAEELERTIETYPIFDNDNNFNHDAFTAKSQDILDRQDRLIVIINTPAHNPTGYSLTLEDWDKVLASLQSFARDKDKKIVLVVDLAYLDFAGDETECRAFLPKLRDLPENILPLIAFSMSKSFTVYGMRGGALICQTPCREIADEFKRVNEFSCRGTWSNSSRSAMVALSKIYSDPQLLQRVRNERQAAQNILLRRGEAFTKAAHEANLDICPYDAGFFVIVNCKNPDRVNERLFQEGIFAVPFDGRGLRISIASISEAWCTVIPEKLAAAIQMEDSAK